jgi:hypothetical protein
MNTKFISRTGIIILVVLVLASILTAVAAANIVSVSRADDQNAGSRTANQLKPKQCDTYNLTTIYICSQNNCRPTGSNVLVLGNNGTKSINASRVIGNSCCLGAPGTTYSNCTWHP